jgi:hypothetical protein
MRKVKLYLLGQKYEVEMEDDFYEYIKNDINKLMNSNSEVKEMLNILLKFSYKSYKSERQLNELLNKLEL